MFGCNLKCQGFGMPAGELSNAYKDIDVKSFDSLEELPLVETGCDSYASWDPRCKHLTTSGSVDTLVEAALKVAPYGTPTERNNEYKTLKGIDVVITGGEPLLGWQGAYPELLSALEKQGCSSVTFETNGTKKLTAEFSDYIKNSKLKIIWSISPKLEESGEPWEKTIVPAAVKSLVDCENTTPYFKFVISCESSKLPIKKALAEYKAAGVRTDVEVYVMPQGGTLKEYSKNAKGVAYIAMMNRWRFSPREQLPLFGNEWGT